MAQKVIAATLELSKPIPAFGESVGVLEFREPTVKEVRKLGLPYNIIPKGDGMVMEIRVDAILSYASLLADVPPSSIDQLALGDLPGVQGVIMGFFGASDPEASPTAPLT
jgi:hypothetical protein